MLGDFNAKVGTEDILKPTISNESLHEISNDNGARVVNFTTSKNQIVSSTMFLHRNIHKCTWTSPDGKTHNQIDHILIDRQRHSSVLDVRSFRAPDGDTDHYLVVAKIMERTAVNKQGSHTFHMERFNLKKLNKVEGKEKFSVEVSNRFAALEDLDSEFEINTVRETIVSKDSLGYYELKQHKPWLDEGWSKLLYRRKQAKLHWLRDNLNNVRCEASRHFKIKKREYLKDKI
jgi:hypothetical protein